MLSEESEMNDVEKADGRTEGELGAGVRGGEGPYVEVWDVRLAEERVVAERGIGGFWFDRKPQSESRYDLSMAGWVVGREMELTSIHVQIVDGPILLHVGLWPREDISKMFGENALADRTAFHAVVDMLHLPKEVELSVWACGKKAKPIAELCRFKARSQFPKVRVEGAITPVMVCTVGRSGSTVLLRGLWEHPEFSVHPLYPYENHYFQYCLHAAGVHTRSCVSPSADFNNKFYLNATSELCPYYNRMPDLDEWFICRHIPTTLSTWVGQGMAFYRDYSLRAGRGEPRFLVEKSTVANLDLELLVHGGISAKMLLLVRDPRDVAASWLKFSTGKLDAVQQTPADAFCNHVVHLAKMFKQILEYSLRTDVECVFVKYEEMMTDTPRVVGEVLRFCGADASEGNIARVAEGIMRDDVSLKSHRTTASVADSFGAWRRELLPWQKAFCDAELGEAVQSLGYSD